MMMTLKHAALMAVIGLTLLPAPVVHAHDAAAGPNGGTMVQVDDKHLEFVTAPQMLTVYLTDSKHGPIATAGASARAIAQVAGNPVTLVLTPAAINTFSGNLDTPLPKGTRVVVTATLGGGANVQARFVVP